MTLECLQKPDRKKKKKINSHSRKGSEDNWVRLLLCQVVGKPHRYWSKNEIEIPFCFCNITVKGQQCCIGFGVFTEGSTLSSA